MNTHDRCPMCDETGIAVQAQDEETLVCDNDACRVVTYAHYAG